MVVTIREMNAALNLIQCPMYSSKFKPEEATTIKNSLELAIKKCLQQKKQEIDFLPELNSVVGYIKELAKIEDKSRKYGHFGTNRR